PHAGMRLVVVKTAESGEVDLEDLRAKLEAHGSNVAAIMITYPSTHGVYEEHVREVCSLVHDAGGQAYIDGANLNALVGLARPGRFGGDVSHLNLHKTFCIPHGGGGPGIGPVAGADHLVPCLPSLTPFQALPVAVDFALNAIDRNLSTESYTPAPSPTQIYPAPCSPAVLLHNPEAYIATMVAEGLTEATKVAVLAANDLATRLRV